MQSLLDLLRGDLRRHGFDDAEWAALLDLAEQEGVVPWAVERLRLLGEELSPEQRKRLHNVRREAEISAFVWTETLKSILAAFDRATLPVISLKGPCLAERLYGNAALRTCYDLDFLVRRPDLRRAEDVLASLGFSPDRYPDDYHRGWSRHGSKVELHHNVENPLAFEFDINAALLRARHSSFQGASVWLLDPADELLFMCLHAVRHRFERLCLILDLAFAFRHLPFASSGAFERRNPEFDSVLALSWMMAARLESQVEEAAYIPPRDRKRLEQLADRLWQERMLGPARPLDWAAQHRFYLELEPPGRRRFLRRWRHFMILLTRLIDADFVFAERFNLRREWQVRLLRPIRLLSEKLHGSSRAV
jgi:hypothetical protein